MFTQSCFIRKNTPELKKKLEGFGYKYGGSDTKSWGSSALYCFDGKYYEVYPAKPTRYHWIEDCETNEALFLALAALRDDTDKNQWFICQEEYISTHTMELVKVGTWQMNTQFDKLTYSLKRLWHKATVEEIIEHFKEK